MNKVTAFFRERPALLLALTAFVLFSLAAAGTQINKLDVRFAMLVQELGSHPLGVFPKLNGVCYPDYFTPWFLLSYLTTCGGSFVNLWTLSLPTMLAGAWLIGLTCSVGEKWQKGVGVAAALLLMTTLEAVYYMCSFGLDVPVAVAGVLMLSVLLKNPDSWKSPLIFAGLLALCILVRGSLGMIVFGAATGGALLGMRKWKALCFHAAAGIVTAALCLGAIVALVIRQDGSEQLKEVLLWQIDNRVAGGDYLFYFIDGLPAFAPLSIFALAGLWLGRRQLKNAPLAPLLGFALLPMIALSIPGGKHLRYLLTILPALALLGGRAVVNAQGAWKQTALRYGRMISPKLPFACLITAITLAAVICGLAPVAEVPLFALGCGAAVFLLLFLVRKRFMAHDGGVFALPALCISAILLLIAIPLTGMREDSRLFVQTVESERKGELYFFDVGPDHEDLKYTMFLSIPERRNVHYLTTGAPGAYIRKMYHTLLFPKALAAVNPEERIICRDNRIKELQKAASRINRRVEILHTGDLGHRRYCAVRLTPAQ